MNATTGEMIAVKQVELPQTASDKYDSRQHTVVRALKMESETLKHLDHPNIVQYLGFEETTDNLSMYAIVPVFIAKSVMLISFARAQLFGIRPRWFCRQLFAQTWKVQSRRYQVIHVPDFEWSRVSA